MLSETSPYSCDPALTRAVTDVLGVGQRVDVPSPQRPWPLAALAGGNTGAVWPTRVEDLSVATGRALVILGRGDAIHHDTGHTAAPEAS